MHPSSEDKLSAIEYIERARGWGRFLEDREANRNGISVKEARVRIARRVGVAPGTLENLRKGRIKQIAAHTYDWLKTAVQAELANEVRAHEHELHILAQTGARPDDGEVLAVATRLAEIKSALNGDAS